MTRSAQLSLVKPAAAPIDPASLPATPRLRVVAHWAYFFEKRRFGVGPQRQRLIDAWLTAYDEETLLLAIEGAASDPWVHEHRAAASALEWLLENEGRIERFAEAGEALRGQVAAQMAREARAACTVAESDPVQDAEAAAAAAAELLALRERVRQAARVKARNGG